MKLMPKNKSSDKNKGFSAKRETGGFTLIELLVVITIIVILSMVGFALFESSQSAARDGKRRADIDAISAALEQKFNPISSTYSALGSTSFQGGDPPQDPMNEDGYTYNGIPAETDPVSSFVICAKLENNNGNSADTDAKKASGEGAPYYCKVSRQGIAPTPTPTLTPTATPTSTP